MIQKFAMAAALTGALMAGAAPAANAGMDDYLGEIVTVGFNFCPRGMMEADGRLLPIFALPDLRGRVMVGAGQGPGLTDRRQGERGGTESDIAGPALAHDGGADPLGDSTAGNNMPPYLALKQCIVTQGIYPSRS